MILVFGAAWGGPAILSAGTRIDGTRETFGSVLEPAGDVNGDGFPDVFASGYRLDSIWLYCGGPNGLGAQPCRTFSWDADYPYPAVTSLGDLDSDGFDDLAIADQDTVWIHHGSGAGGDLEPAATLSAVMDFSRREVGAADLDGDGILELAVLVEPDTLPLVQVYPGADVDADPVVIAGTYAGFDSFGERLVAAGDTDGDGYGDLAIGAPYDFDGMVSVVPGGPAGAEPSGIVRLFGEGDRAGFGYDMVALGDVDRDGFDDLAVAAPALNDTVSSRVWVVHGGPAGVDLDGAEVLVGEVGSAFGYAVGATNVDEDGVVDVLVSTSDEVQVFRGPGFVDPLTVTASTDVRYDGALTTPGDIDGDGHGDVVIGASDDEAIEVRYGRTDTDFDGTTENGDCAPADPEIHPGAAERIGDEVDQDCDGTELCRVDADGDGRRTDDTVSSADPDCSDPGEARNDAVPGDCDDADPAVWPLAPEIPGDGIDQDCDGVDSPVPPTDRLVSGLPIDGSCGCATGGGGSWLAWVAVGLVLWRRRWS